ncbi:glycoside hydrolase family 31 protein [Uliginosibacterium sp. 31-16]|uniref:glycoside hydrolase family 31 protein n=1 Tax=Uliginosibacterium sp. 31-16 TaxID=3068315 RepID=UPI00273F4012|nr:glycoside hydrolase family 31 protein [Uliginosibacterium sp. 31-16]MDP5238851.1 glycoside hydrolase family 31 protein [Uliginosibacterium sp. 31-16]
MPLDKNPEFSLSAQQRGQLTLSCAEKHVAHVFVLEEDIVRVMLLPLGELRFPQTWAIAPGAEDVPPEGRDRFDLSGFSLPDFQLEQTPEELCIETKQIRLRIRLAGFFCNWEVRRNGIWQQAASDRPTQSYNFAWWDEKVYHYLQRSADEMYFGLGERAGEADRHGKSYRMCNLDPMGYSARSSDPLYKHIPFYLTWKKTSHVAFGLFYDTLSDCSFDMGREMDNYHGHYRKFVADHGDLDFYFIAGDTIAAITRRYTWMTGRPAFMPKWSIGYSGSTMTYTDAPDAQAQMNKFLEGCEKHDILCDSFHLSSGYTSIGPKRYVFNWNREKFPDPARFVHDFLDRGVKLCPNIKPCLLRDHPRFIEAEAKGLFVHEANGTPTQVQFWDETGAYLDFTNPQTIAWWKARVTDALLTYGIAATWNDNNEFEIWSDSARITGFGTPRAAREAKPLQTLLMLQSSRAAQSEFAPAKRPFLVSRSGAAGMQRYVQTWSGDNYTSWETLRYNIKMALGLALSGVSNTGHDIGGFAGPAPEPELLLRWVQHGIFLPRFSIHSWNDDKTVNEPWMYPQITPHIRQLIKFRYTLLPYFYDLLWRSHSAFEPMIRPTFYDFPEDERCYADTDDTLLGANMLVASVVEPGARTRAVYLPAGAGWYDFWSGDHFAGGQTITLPAPWDRPPLLVREGSAIPLNLAEQHFGKPADERGFAVFPLRGEGVFEDRFFEDDGESQAYRDGQYGHWVLRVQGTAETISLSVQADGQCPPSRIHHEVRVLLPRQEIRAIRATHGQIVSDRETADWRELRLALPV